MNRLSLLLAALLITGCGGERVAAPPDQRLDGPMPDFRAATAASQISLMTQNMYFGAPVEPIMAAPFDQVPAAVAQAWAIVQQTDFPARAAALAGEIAKDKPDVIGLQEVATFYVQTPSDFLSFDFGTGQVVVGNPFPNATAVVIDFLPTLLGDLAARGLTYHVAAQVLDSDIEMPRFDGFAPQGFPLFSDVRLKDYDVVLVRDGLAWENAATGNFATVLPVNEILAVKRGWAAADVTVKGMTYRVVSTHLESDNETTKRAQAEELVQLFADETKPLIIVGDFNSGPGRTAPGGQQTYDFMLGSGYGDMWLLRSGAASDGFSCCNAGDLSNTTPDGWLTERIDLMLLRNVAGTGPRSGGSIMQAWLVGSEEKDLARDGVWPSDHAGVAARMTFPNPGR